MALCDQLFLVNKHLLLPNETTLLAVIDPCHCIIDLAASLVIGHHGDDLVRGSISPLAHHIERSYQLADELVVNNVEIVLTVLLRVSYHERGVN